MSFWAPALRSRHFGDRQLTAGAIVKIGLITWLSPALIGGSLIVPLTLLPESLQWPPLAFLGAMAGLMIFSPFYGIMAVPLALLIGAWAMRIGLAGWGVALTASLCLPIAIGALYQAADPTAAAIGSMLALTPIFMLHAVVLWASTRWLAPEALLPAPS